MAEYPYAQDVSEEERYAQSKLLPVVTALLVSSILSVTGWLFGLVYFVFFPAIDEPNGLRLNEIFVIVIGILISLVIAGGALSMLRRGSYAFAMTASILAMLPGLGSCYGLTLPIGIWSLRVLRDPVVRGTFRTAETARPESGS